MPAVPPAADKKKPAGPPPAKAGADAGKDKKPDAGGPKGADSAKGPDAAKGADADKGAEVAKGGDAGKQPAPAAPGKDATDKGGSGAAPTQGAKDDAKAGAKDGAKERGQQRFDRMAVRAKLAVSEPGDAVEHQADQVAEQVSRKVDTRGGAKSGAGGGEKGDKKNPAHAKPGADQKKPAVPAPLPPTPSVGGPVARTTDPRSADHAEGPENADNAHGDQPLGGSVEGDATHAAIREQAGRGEAMSDDVRLRMEREFGHDFSHVRIHQDIRANDLCRSLRALAFTAGSDIYFATGRYQPETPAGIKLLAHELAHVCQQTAGGPAIARKIDPALDAKYQEKTGGNSAGPLAALMKLDIPAVKARNLGFYKALLPGNLKRKRGYERGNPAQVEVWNKQIQISETRIRERLQARGIQNVPQSTTETFKVAVGKSKKPTSKSIKQLQTLLKIPTWSSTGQSIGTGYQVDHVVELQVSGDNGTGVGNDIKNMELLDQPSNSSSGGAIRAGIYSKVDAYLACFKPAPKRQAFLKKSDIVFEDVRAAGGGGAAASSWWTSADIIDAKPLEQVAPAPPDNREGTANEFLLLGSPGGVVVQRIKHDPGPGTFNITGLAQSAINGLKMTSVTLNDAAATGGGPIGSVAATFNLPAQWTPAQNAVTLTLTGDGKHRGYPSSLGGQSLEFKHLSALPLPEIGIDDGQITADGNLTPSLPLLNAPIRVSLRGDDIRFSMDYGAGTLSLGGGVTVDDAAISVFYSSKEGFGLGGSLDFTIGNTASGSLSASFTEAAGIALEGQVDFDTSLFDVAKVKAWYRQGKFGAKGELKITKPNKIKGIKSASLEASYEEGGKIVATGSADTDVPGLKDFKAELSYQDEENFSVTGSADFEKLPGIESGSLTMTLDRQGGDWSLSGSGTAVPSLPGSTKAAISASYKKGLITIKGSVHVAFGNDLLTGDVEATVTNAASVGADGTPSGSPGKSFKAFGKGSIAAKLGPITGKVDLELKPSGDVLIGGTLTAEDQKLFDEYPPKKEGGDQPELHTIAQVPIPGLGFGVGGVNVGVVLGAKWGYNAYASIGPGYARGIHLTIAKFNPKNFKPSDIKVEDAGAKVEIPANAGVSLSAAIELTLEAAVVRGGARLTATALAEIPKEPPAITGAIKFKWSYDDGLSINSQIKVSPKAVLKFTLSGTGFAELNLLVKTVTIWSKTWPLGEVAFNLPLNFTVGASLGWSSSKGFTTEPADLLKAPEVKLGGDDFRNIAEGKKGDVVTKDEETGNVIPDDELVCRQPTPGFEPDQSVMPPDMPTNTSVNPQADEGARAGGASRGGAAGAESREVPEAVDENLVKRLGPGMPLDDATRGFFEQEMRADFSDVQVHTTDDAAAEAEKLSARAFTVGSHIAFAEGEYDVDSENGRQLLAHELAHVLQQQKGAARQVARQPEAPSNPAPAAPALGSTLAAPSQFGVGDTLSALGGVVSAALAPRDLRRGDTGWRVSALQQRLNDRGAEPPLTIDGIFGRETHAAVVEQQQRLGMKADGVVTGSLLAVIVPAAAAPAGEVGPWGDPIKEKKYPILVGRTQVMVDEDRYYAEGGQLLLRYTALVNAIKEDGTAVVMEYKLAAIRTLYEERFDDLKSAAKSLSNGNLVWAARHMNSAASYVDIEAKAEKMYFELGVVSYVAKELDQATIGFFEGAANALLGMVDTGAALLGYDPGLVKWNTGQYAKIKSGYASATNGIDPDATSSDEIGRAGGQVAAGLATFKVLGAGGASGAVFLTAAGVGGLLKTAANFKAQHDYLKRRWSEILTDPVNMVEAVGAIGSAMGFGGAAFPAYRQFFNELGLVVNAGQLGLTAGALFRLSQDKTLSAADLRDKTLQLIADGFQNVAMTADGVQATRNEGGTQGGGGKPGDPDAGATWLGTFPPRAPAPPAPGARGRGDGHGGGPPGGGGGGPGDPDPGRTLPGTFPPRAPAPPAPGARSQGDEPGAGTQRGGGGGPRDPDPGRTLPGTFPPRAPAPPAPGARSRGDEQGAGTQRGGGKPGDPDAGATWLGTFPPRAPAPPAPGARSRGDEQGAGTQGGGRKSADADAADTLPVKGIRSRAPALDVQLRSAFRSVGGEELGFSVMLVDDHTAITGASGARGEWHPGRVGATTHGTTVYVHESIVRADGVVRPWGAKLNLRQVIAHELGHAMALSDRTNCCYASSIGSGLDGLTFKERQGLFDDAVRIAPYEDVPVRLLGPPPDAEGAQSGGGTPARGPGELYQAHVSGEYGVLADLDQDGMLNLYIKAKPGVTPRGSEMFNDALNAFGPNVRGVRGTWLGGGDIADNFDSFKGLLSSGLSPEQAALGTFTGKMASRAGFSNVRVVMDTGSKVVVEFSR